jgi:hypothetical protein
MAYDEYTELTRIRRQAAKQKALAVIDAISQLNENGVILPVITHTRADSRVTQKTIISLSIHYFMQLTI